jgi:hypothetical protein
LKRILLATIAVVALAATGGGPAWAARSQTCTGEGTMHTDPAMQFTTVTTMDFEMSVLAACTTGPFIASGSLTGACVPGSSGDGTTYAGSHFDMTIIGNVLTTGGGVTSAMFIVPDLAKGDTCTPVTSADDFRLTGVILE